VTGQLPLAHRPRGQGGAARPGRLDGGSASRVSQDRGFRRGEATLGRASAGWRDAPARVELRSGASAGEGGVARGASTGGGVVAQKTSGGG
jgi:hypothetical protein